eukprot:scaffold31908_cov55-Cyclotella_meneghiniana.AAC.1
MASLDCKTTSVMRLRGRYMDGARAPWSMLFHNIEHSLATGGSSVHDSGVKPVDDGRLKPS